MLTVGCFAVTAVATVGDNAWAKHQVRHRLAAARRVVRDQSGGTMVNAAGHVYVGAGTSAGR